MYIYIYMYLYLHIYVYIYVYAYVTGHVYLLCALSYIHIYTYIYIYIHIYIYIYICIYVTTYLLCALPYIYIYTYIYIYIYTYICIYVTTYLYLWHDSFTHAFVTGRAHLMGGCLIIFCSLLQSVAVCCSLLQSVTMCCSIIKFLLGKVFSPYVYWFSHTYMSFSTFMYVSFDICTTCLEVHIHIHSRMPNVSLNSHVRIHDSPLWILSRKKTRQRGITQTIHLYQFLNLKIAERYSVYYKAIDY